MMGTLSRYEVCPMVGMILMVKDSMRSNMPGELGCREQKWGHGAHRSGQERAEVMFIVSDRDTSSKNNKRNDDANMSSTHCKFHFGA